MRLEVAALYASVGAGGAIGAMLRFGVSQFMESLNLALSSFTATAIVNVTGSAVLGIIGGLMSDGLEINQDWRAFIFVGCLGGFTTFSAFTMDATTLWIRLGANAAMIYIFGTIVLSLVLFYAFFGIASGTFR